VLWTPEEVLRVEITSPEGWRAYPRAVDEGWASSAGAVAKIILP